MATYNDLPTEITANIFSYLRHERRKPVHALPIMELIVDVDRKVITRDGKYRVPQSIYESLGCCIDYDNSIDFLGCFPFDMRGGKWHHWWKDDRGRLIASLYINIISNRLNEEDYRRLIAADYEDEDVWINYVDDVDYSVEISGQWLFTNC